MALRMDGEARALNCHGLRQELGRGAGRTARVSLGVSSFVAMRCPYLEQILRKRELFLKVFQADCHVDGRAHSFRGLVHWPQPPCLGKMATCALYQEARYSEDLILRKLAD